jgi:hypothetical protein
MNKMKNVIIHELGWTHPPAPSLLTVFAKRGRAQLAYYKKHCATLRKTLRSSAVNYHSVAQRDAQGSQFVDVILNGKCSDKSLLIFINKM